MTKALYNRDILRLASQLQAGQILQGEHPIVVQASKSAQICGSQIDVQAALDADHHIKDAVFKVQSCALGQASAALLIEYMHGHNVTSLQNMRGAVCALLNGENAKIMDYPKLEILSIAREYSARHAAILLPYDALLIALNNARKDI